MSKEIKNVIEIKPDGVKGMDGGAYTIAFVYSNKGNFIVKGYYREVKNHLKSLHNKGYKYFVNYTLWSKEYGVSRSRSIWYFWKEDDTYIYAPSPKMFQKDYSYKKEWNKWIVGDYDKNIKLTFKRLPKKWIPEFEKL